MIKFKSVEISGFRIYDDPKDSTFNFTTDDGEVADFVSLYAPNGFGRTSFYDAVEWGMTKTIERFLLNNKAEKSIKQQRASTKGTTTVIKNRNSTRDTYVKIINHNSEEIVDRVLPPLKSNAVTDLYIPKRRDDRDRFDFLDVILSQEWISAFLKEADGKTRYKKFMENSDLQEVDIYYQKVLAISDANKNQISLLSNEVAELFKKITNTENKDILDVVNKQIERINSANPNVNMQLVKPTTTDKQIKALRDTISNKVAEEQQLLDLEKIIDNIRIAHTGDENILSKKQFHQAQDYKQSLKKEIDRLEKKEKGFIQLSEIENKRIKQKEAQQEIAKQLDQLVILSKHLPTYNQVNKLIEDKSKSLKEQFDVLKEIDESIGVSNRKLIILEAKDLELKRKISTNKNAIEALPDLKLKTEIATKEISETEILLKSRQTEVLKSKTELKKIQDEIEELNKVKDELLIGQYSYISVKEVYHLEQVIKNLEQIEDRKFSLKAQLAALEETINNQQSLDTALKDFISSGLAIVNESKMESCPLCEHNYESYKKLSDRILGNKALSDALQVSLKDKTSYVQKIGRIEDDQKKQIEALNEYYNSKISGLLDKRKVAQENVKEQISIESLHMKKLESLREAILRLIVKMDNRDIVLYEKDLLALRNENEKQEPRLKTEFDQEKSINQNLISEKSKHNNIITLISNEIKEQSENKSFIEVQEWLKRNPSELGSATDLFDSLTIKWRKEAETNKKNLQKLENELIVLNKTTDSANETQVKEELIHKREQHQINNNKILAYEYFLNVNLKIKQKDLIEGDLTEIIKIKEEAAKKELVNLNNQFAEYRRLGGFLENIIPFLQSEAAKVKMISQKTELKYLKDIVTPLIESEIKNTKDFLDNQIEAFFYEDIINDIYSKIDPHPEFKKVRFEASFSESSPSLDVYVENDQDDCGKNSLIPNLYFSTAQINILSLSIFLATALNSEAYDCIFIDDPIQSMDNINVLSTIDLLRSIVINNKKQIILSTHDENFHNLLKMKIPSDLFRSKFLELESFGKLKQA